MGVANTLAVPAIEPPFRIYVIGYAALPPPCFIVVGLFVVGAAHRMDVAIGRREWAERYLKQSELRDYCSLLLQCPVESTLERQF